MTANDLEAFTRPARFARARRDTLKALGATVLVAAGAMPPAVRAGKNGKKCKKAKFSEEKCSRQTEYCQEAIAQYCGSNSGCIVALLPCCVSCLTGPAVTCIMETLPTL